MKKIVAALVLVTLALTLLASVTAKDSICLLYTSRCV